MIYSAVENYSHIKSNKAIGDQDNISYKTRRTQ